MKAYEKEEVVRDKRTGKAVTVKIKAMVGPKLVTFIAPIEPSDLEEVGVLKATAQCYKDIAKARVDLTEERSRPSWPTMNQWYDHWFTHRYVKGTWYVASYKGRESHIAKLWHLVRPDLGSQSMDSIRPATINKVLNKLKLEGYSVNYLREVHKMLDRMFQDAISIGWDDGYGPVRWRAKHNPVQAVQRMRPAEKQHVILSDKMLVDIIAVSEERHAGDDEKHFTTCIIALQALLGLRVSEACLLRWEQLRFDQQLVEGAIGTITWKTGERKHGQPLVLPLPASALPFLPMHRKATEGRLWSGHGLVRHMTDYVNKELRACAQQLGIPTEGLSSHSIRHSFAHSLHEIGENVNRIQHALGHSSSRSTETYLKGMEHMRRAAGAVLPRASTMFSPKGGAR